MANKVYVGIVEWNGVENQGLHAPLVDRETFDKVQELASNPSDAGHARAQTQSLPEGQPQLWRVWAATVHAVIQGQVFVFLLPWVRKTGGKERDVESVTCRLICSRTTSKSSTSGFSYPKDWLEQLREVIAEEIDNQQQRTNNERKALEKRKATAEAEKHKLMDAYYAGAIDVEMLKSEQNRIGDELRINWRADGPNRRCRGGVACDLGEGHGLGRRVRTRPTAIASERGRRMLNQAIIKNINIRDGKIAEVEYHEPFNLLFSAPEFEYVRQVELQGLEPWASSMPWKRSTT